MDKKDKTTSWSWKITPEELNEQIDGYNTLKITQTYRGVSVIIVSALLLLSLVFAFFDVYPLEDIVFSLFIYIPILFFVYRGHRWAIIALLGLWTFEKGYTLYTSVQSGGGVWGSIIWWLIVTPYIYKALVVENHRRKLAPAMAKLEGVYCTKCGTRQEKDAKFCTKCGTEVLNPNT